MNEPFSKEGFVGISKDVFLLQYNESAKVIDFCKNQQWYVLGLGVGINYGMIVICQQYLKVFLCFKITILLMMIGITLAVPIIGLIILLDLVEKAHSHRDNIRRLKNESFLVVPKELHDLYFASNNTYFRDTLYLFAMEFALIISSVICLLILSNALLTLFH